MKLTLACEKGTVEAEVNEASYHYLVAALTADALAEEVDAAFRQAAVSLMWPAALPDNTEGTATDSRRADDADADQAD